MNAASIDIKDMLEAAGLGLTYKENLFLAKEPDTPDDVVTVYDTPGFAPDMSLASSTEKYYRSSVQIRIRNKKYTTGMTVARNILDTLHGREDDITWNGTVYTVIQATGEPVPLAWDENNRTILIIHFNLQRR